MLRREALVILRDGCMLEGDGLKAGNVDTGTQDVFIEPVCFSREISPQVLLPRRRGR